MTQLMVNEKTLLQTECLSVKVFTKFPEVTLPE